MANLTLKHDGNVASFTLDDSEAQDEDVYLKYVQRELDNVQPDIFSSVCESYLHPPLYHRFFRIFKLIAIAIAKIISGLCGLCLVVVIALILFLVIYNPCFSMPPEPQIPTEPPKENSVDIFSILLGSGGIIALVQTFLNMRRGEISVKRNDEGKITEINFKGVAHKEVPTLLKEISKALEKSDNRLLDRSNHS